MVTFSGPADLCMAVSEQVEAWQLLGLSYFTPISTDEIQLLEDTLTRLKEERYKVCHRLLIARSGQSRNIYVLFF